MTLFLLIVFVVGYAAIAFEHNIKIDKAASALITGVTCWAIYALLSGPEGLHEVTHHLHEHLGEIAGILFFLMGAMTIVEIVDAHGGFEVITSRIKSEKLVNLIWTISFITFFLSAVLDNLTTTIVMVSVLRKLIRDHYYRLFFVSIVVIAANAGGAWSPLGDVTTTMLWIDNKITTQAITTSLILPSLICLVAPLLVVSLKLRGKTIHDISPQEGHMHAADSLHISHADVLSVGQKTLIFVVGIGGLLFVPIFKSLTHLPPFMGILFSLGVMWVVTELTHRNIDDTVRDPLSVVSILRRIDTPSILFFMGILLAVASLQSTGMLKALAGYLDTTIGHKAVIGILLGILSAIVDNVPLVAAAIGMYNDLPTDHFIWEFVAYTAGTGGSMLIIGSAAGVAAMGMEKIDFMWYLKNIGWLAALGYFAGAGWYIMFHSENAVVHLF